MAKKIDKRTKSYRDSQKSIQSTVSTKPSLDRSSDWAEFGLVQSRQLSNSQTYLYSTSVRKSIHVRTSNVCSAQIKFYKGDIEVTSGKTVEFFKQPYIDMNLSTWVGAILTNNLLNGWAGTSKMVLGGTLIGLKPLNTVNLLPDNRAANLLKQYTYTDTDGSYHIYLKNQLYLIKNYNPISETEGLSPLDALAKYTNTQVAILDYNRAYFENGATGSVILNFKKKQQPDILKKATNVFKDNHAGANNAFKVMAISDGDLEIKELGKGQQDKYLDLLKIADAAVYGAYNIPPIISGQYDGAKYDSADVQYRAFIEQCLIPDAKLMEDYIQNICDKEFSEGLTVEVDIDSIPIVAQLKNSAIDNAAKLISTFGISPQEAADFYGIKVDCPDETEDEEEEESFDEKIIDYRPYEKWFRNYRNDIIKSLVSDAKFNKDKYIKEINESELEYKSELIIQVHKDFIYITKHKSLEDVKKYMNDICRKSYVKEIIHGKD